MQIWSAEIKELELLYTSMDHLNSLSTYGTHPKDFDPEQVKPVLNNFAIIIKWYLKYKDAQTISRAKVEEPKYESKGLLYFKEGINKPKKRLIFLLSGLLLVVAIVVVILFVFNIIGDRQSAKGMIDLEKSIAVLPFDNLSDDSEFAHLGDAMTDEIIMQLYKINEFEVRSRTSVMQYKNTEKGSPLIGRELNANYLLEGTVQRYMDQVRIRVQLIHASTDDHIWGEIYEGDWKEIFDIQINVAKQIARELKTVLSPEEVKKIEEEPTKNIEAYNLYLQGRYFWNQGGRDNLDKSLECYKRALEIDNTLGEAHAELALARVINDWDWTGGEKGFKQALELNPNYASAHNRYAWLLTYVGRLDEAIQEARRAHELDPLSIGIWLDFGRRYYFAREYDKAIEEYRKVLELFPNSASAHALIALALSQKGLHNEAIEEYSKIEPVTSRYDWYLGYIYGAAGKKEKALEILNYYIELSKKEFVWPTNIAFIYIGLGEKDKAFEWLEKTYQQHEAWLDLLQVEPMYDNLRSDSRFQDLLQRMNFPD